MKEISIPLECFDIDAFLDRTIDCLSSEVTSEIDPTYIILWVDRPGDVPGYGGESGWELDAARKQETRRSPPVRSRRMICNHAQPLPMTRLRRHGLQLDNEPYTAAWVGHLTDLCSPMTSANLIKEETVTWLAISLNRT